MEPWRIVLLVLLVIVLIPTVTLMNQVSDLKAKGDKEALKKKEAQLKTCTRLLIAVFIVVLAATLYLHYSGLLSS